jgi:hypothetical protein
VHQQNYPSQSGNKPTKPTKEKEEEQKKGPLKCWGCGEEHLLRDFPHRKNDHRRIYNVQEATTINDVARMYHKFMQLLKINKKTTKLQWWSWKV